MTSIPTSSLPPERKRVGSGSLDGEESFSSSEQDAVLEKIRIMTYDDRNHWSILTQLYGSVWPRTLNFCIANMVVTLIVFYLLRDYTMDATGHRFMALILSFLVVTRASITYGRYMQARSYLETCYKSCRELVQHMCILTQDDLSDGAKVWRHNVAYRTIILLRITMATIEYESQRTSPWEIPELTQADQSDQMVSVEFLNRDSDEDLREEYYRAPLLYAYALRKEIMEQRSGAFLESEFRHVNEELKLLDCVTEFVKAFTGVNSLVTCPFPFPLVQMARTFLIVWVYTLPFVLCHDEHKYPFAPLIIIFLTTFGFIGIEQVCIELDDPFGDDDNDFDDLGMAQLVFEDIYIAIYKLDGYDAAHALRRKIVNRIKRGPALSNYQNDYQHGFEPQKEETIQYDRRHDFSRESPFYVKKKKQKKKKTPSLKTISKGIAAQFALAKEGKESERLTPTPRLKSISRGIAAQFSWRKKGKK